MEGCSGTATEHAGGSTAMGTQVRLASPGRSESPTESSLYELYYDWSITIFLSVPRAQALLEHPPNSTCHNWTGGPYMLLHGVTHFRGIEADEIASLLWNLVNALHAC